MPSVQPFTVCRSNRERSDLIPQEPKAFGNIEVLKIISSELRADKRHVIGRLTW